MDSNGYGGTHYVTTSFRPIKPTDTLPAIIAVTALHDSGEYGNASCPHCGALGRYVFGFICADGSRRGAMSGCIKMFPVARENSRYAKLIQEAFDRRRKAAEEKKNLAKWWQEMIDAAEVFGAQKYPDHDSIQAATATLHRAIAQSEGRRQDWLQRNGYARRR